MHDFSIIKRAGLTQGEFSSLVGVTRATTNMWVSGKMKPNRYITDHVAIITATIERAIDNGQLPLPRNIARTKRPEALCSVIKANRDTTSKQ